LIEALVAFGDFTAGSVSCTGGSSVVTSSVQGAVAASLFGSSSSLKAKGNRFYTTRKEESKYNKIIEFKEHLRCHEVKKFKIFFLNRGSTGCSSLSRGTRRRKLFNTLPLLVNTSVLRNCRRRQRRRAGIFYRSFGIISVLILFSLGGFGNNSGQISQKRPLLWKGRA
jgi:hypothetical protein